LAAISAALRRQWRRIALLTVGAAALAYAVAWMLPRWYASEASLTVDSGQPTSAAGLGGLTGMALGLGIGTDQAASPEFYVSLIESRSLGRELLTTTLPIHDGISPTTLVNYWSRHVPPTPKDTARALKRLSKHLHASADPRTSIVSFRIEAPGAEAAKILADSLLAQLNRRIIAIRTGKAADQRRFLESRFIVASDSLKAQDAKLRAFLEQNRDITAPRLGIERARLERDASRLNAVYSDVARQLEQARLEEVRHTPVITTIDSPVTPVRRSSPKRMFIALTAGVLGAGFALLMVLMDLAAGEGRRKE
jgi:uncharacterized protein involved in exopolysaccharide biosynthesis